MRTFSILSFRQLTSWMAVLCLVVLAFTLVACGGDSGSSSNTTSGSTSGSGSKMTVNIKESKGADGKDQYAFDPLTITVKTGDTVTFQNQSDELQDIDGGDAGKAGVDVKVPVNQSANATFKTAGTFTLKSEKGATITVTVQ